MCAWCVHGVCMVHASMLVVIWCGGGGEFVCAHDLHANYVTLYVCVSPPPPPPPPPPLSLSLSHSLSFCLSLSLSIYLFAIQSDLMSDYIHDLEQASKNQEQECDDLKKEYATLQHVCSSHGNMSCFPSGCALYRKRQGTLPSCYLLCEADPFLTGLHPLFIVTYLS